ncbi:MAG: hypothetical protein R3F14_43620 [Polyangiaceae bacterium]
MGDIRIDETLAERLRCAACRGELAREARRATCAACGATFPVVRGVPVLVDERRSLFTIDECVGSSLRVRHAGSRSPAAARARA